MKSVGVFYGSSTGTTQDIAAKLAKALGVDASNVFDIAKSSVVDFANYDVLLLGSSTWGDGDLQDDWMDVESDLESVDLTGKDVALFGVGDGYSYSDSFCSAVGKLHSLLQASNCNFIGAMPTEGYEFDDSEALDGDHFVGLLIDEDNDSDKTTSRIDAWVAQVKPLLG